MKGKKPALETVSSFQGAALFQRWDADMVLVREVSPAPVMASSLYFDWLSLRQVITKTPGRPPSDVRCLARSSLVLFRFF